MQKGRNDSATWRPRDVNDSDRAVKNEIPYSLDQGYSPIGAEFARDIVITTDRSVTDSEDRESSWTNTPWLRRKA